MRRFDPERTAAHIAEHRAARRPLLPLRGDLAPVNAAEGAAAQAAFARQLDAMPPAGFKIGATARRMQEYLGLSGPVAGFMPASGVHSSGARLPFAGFVRPGVECELVVRLRQDIPPGPCTADQAFEATSALFAGIEIVENRYSDIGTLGVPTLMADQVYHAACICGDERADWSTIDINLLRGSLRIDGVVKGEGKATDLLGNPFNSLAWLASSAEAAAFGGLRAGQLVMLGSVTPPIWLEAPADVVVDFEGLPAVEVALM